MVGFILILIIVLIFGGKSGQNAKEFQLLTRMTPPSDCCHLYMEGNKGTASVFSACLGENKVKSKIELPAGKASGANFATCGSNVDYRFCQAGSNGEIECKGNGSKTSELGFYLYPSA